jgi:hypothetical protein
MGTKKPSLHRQEQEPKPPPEKPWKSRNKGGPKHDVQIEIHVPTLKQKEEKKEPEAPTETNFSYIEIREFGRKPSLPSTPTNLDKPDEHQDVGSNSSQNEEGQDMPANQ